MGEERQRSSDQRTRLTPRRRLGAWLMTLGGLPALTAALNLMHDHIGLTSVILAFLLFVVIDATIGGIAPALVASVGGFLAVNWFFTPPLHTWSVEDGENLIALVVYLVTAAIVSALVSVAARREAEATRAGAEAETLAVLSTSVVEADPVTALVSHLRTAFALTGATILSATSDGGWWIEAADGRVASQPGQADHVEPLGNDVVLALTGADLGGEDRRVLTAFAANLAAALDRRRLHAEATEAAARAEANELRSALLQAVSHDLRTPLAGIKASVNSLRQPDLSWTQEQTAEFLATVEEETDRLTYLVDNLLDMSRINAKAVAPELRPTGLEEVVPAAVASLGPRGREVLVDIPEHIPPVDADPALLERVVANLADNALTHGGEHQTRIEAQANDGRVLVRVIDRGPGIPASDRVRVFEPFQRLDDTAPRRGAGVGLGLAVARGFTRAMNGDLVVDDTPGGGATLVVDLAASGR